MKFSIKITLSFFGIMIFSLGIGGFLIIQSSFVSEVDLNLRNSLNNNQFIATIYYSISTHASFDNRPYLLKELQSISNNGQVFIGVKEDIRYFEDSLFVSKLKNNEQGSQILDKNDKKFLQVITKLVIEEKEIYIENLVDITAIYELRDKNYHRYCIFLISIAIFSSIVIAIFSIHITRPLTKLKQTSEMIAACNLKKRNSVSEMTSPEFISLSKSFNDMADKLESMIEELKEQNQRQDDFISRFTHELKTPLTSIIGYAELLRTYDMEPCERFTLANYIYKEGKRLEDLSQHLLQLILLKQECFPLKMVSTNLFFQDLNESLKILLKKYQVTLQLEIEHCYFKIEPVLLRSLLYNLIDNACKASSKGQLIILSGKVIGNYYHIAVIDFGMGIPKNSLDKVTIPFYMVDKSRARKQGGAGIGLSLCQEIARIHGSSLSIQSEPRKGTTISFDVEMVNDEE